ncbi:signal peptidase I [Desulforamulus ferrireducens]|uniref:Signal peptidase I n=1 Tax=Desulforamulus ferrireducens TaxID=1833852 RepID=A0A1S6IV35_9FIRM|nr:signal peptidase I [Desulforamulus ferrireducens]AQS58639.1 signal peptidase I [Desulforamulus ferrireducens]
MSKKFLREWVATVVIALVLSLVVRTYIAEARWIPSESMLPTLKVGDHLLIDKAYYKLRGLERGDIVVFQAPPTAQEDKDLIKRVIGLPGEKIAIKDGIVYINDQPLDESYIFEKPHSDFNAIIIPEDKVFVMGDNRNNSYDSRYWGTLPMENIIGKAILLYYPFEHIEVFHD